MKIFTPPFYSRKINFLLLGGLILLLSCQSDPIVYNPTGGYEYQKKSFQINDETSETVQGDLHTGMSPRLYSGILSNGDMVSTLIRLLPEVLDSHQVCSLDSISGVNISLSSITQLAEEDTNLLIQKDAIQIHLISLNEIWNEDVVLDSARLSIITHAINTASTLSDSLIEIKNQSIDIQLFDHDSDIIQRWCETQEELGIVVSYIPTDSSYLEFHSSDSNEGPRLFVEYTDTNTVSNTYNRYLFNNVYWAGDILDEIDNGPHYIEVASSDNWDVINIFAFNLKENSPIPSLEMQSYDPLLFQDDIITTENLKTDISLLKINVELNSDIEEMDSIIFSLNSAIAFRSNDDPSGDNQTNANPDSTENNLEYDLGELFNDYGIDACPDSLEAGNNMCSSSSLNSIYNPAGTENNDVLDWDDIDESGTWDEGEGEEWWDDGIDGCEDLYEIGNNLCATTVNSNWIPGLDLNGDNYNIDPKGDDWSEDNPNGTEGNEVWNMNEPFQDWGSDGLPASMLGGEFDINNTEGNGIYEIGEPFFDTGEDGLFNSEETGYNKDGTENNNQFDGDGEFNDCGEDNCCNSDANCIDVGDDDYNDDPNNDNFAIDSTFTQGNFIIDWTDDDNDGLWDEGEGEKWYDWGTDKIPDSLESFEASVWILPVLHGNYMFDLNNEFLQEPPISTSDTVSLWISEIKKVDDNSLKIEVSVQSNKALKGLQFRLNHIPFTKVDTILETYTHSIPQPGEDKLFEDLTLLPRSEYDPLMLDTTLQINYANDVAAFLDFDSLNLFLENEEYIFSHQYSNLVFYIDTPNTDIHEDGMWVYLTHSSDSGEEKTLSVPIGVTSSSDSVEIKIGQILSLYQSGSIGSYNGLQLKAYNNLYNYSKLSIKNNPRIDVMYSQ